MVSAALIMPLIFICIFAVYSYGYNLYEKVIWNCTYRIQQREDALIDGIIKKDEADFIRRIDSDEVSDK